MKKINLVLPLIALSALNPTLIQGLPTPATNENNLVVRTSATAISHDFHLESTAAIANELNELKEATVLLNSEHTLLKRAVLEKRGLGYGVKGIVDKGVAELTTKANSIIARLTNGDLKKKASQILSEGIREINEKLESYASFERQYERCSGFWRSTCRA